VTLRYHVLNSIAGLMWRAVVDLSDWDPVRQDILREYACNAEQLDADWAAFCGEALEAGWLVDASDAPSLVGIGDIPAAKAPVTRSLVQRWGWLELAAYAAFWRVRRAIRRGTLPAFLEYCEALATGPTFSCCDHSAALRAFLHAEALQFDRAGPDDCLVRSLALFSYLRSRQIACRHLIGVRRQPFLAHAWVEIDQVALLEGQTDVGQLVPISVIG
jgi:hypothetical protein